MSLWCKNAHCQSEGSCRTNQVGSSNMGAGAFQLYAASLSVMCPQSCSAVITAGVLQKPNVLISIAEAVASCCSQARSLLCCAMLCPAEPVCQPAGPYLTLNMDVGLNTPQPMGCMRLSQTATMSPAEGGGRPTTHSTAPPYTCRGTRQQQQHRTHTFNCLQGTLASVGQTRMPPWLEIPSMCCA
jgi:hypothetical protein